MLGELTEKIHYCFIWFDSFYDELFGSSNSEHPLPGHRGHKFVYMYFLSKFPVKVIFHYEFIQPNLSNFPLKLTMKQDRKFDYVLNNIRATNIKTKLFLFNIKMKIVSVNIILFSVNILNCEL